MTHPCAAVVVRQILCIILWPPSPLLNGVGWKCPESRCRHRWLTSPRLLFSFDHASLLVSWTAAAAHLILNSIRLCSSTIKRPLTPTHMRHTECNFYPWNTIGWVLNSNWDGFVTQTWQPWYRVNYIKNILRSHLIFFHKEEKTSLINEAYLKTT